MNNLDFYFHYKNVLRFLLIQKIGYKNTHLVPELTKIKIYFSVKNLIDLDDLRGSNFFFFLKFFLGRRSFFTNYSTKFSLNVLYHNFNIQTIIKKREMYFVLNFFFYDLVPFSRKSYSIFNPRKSNSITYIFKDMNIFLEKKTHTGFLNLKNNLNIRFFNSGYYYDKKWLFKLFKFRKI
jgi:hypothetical protein